MTDWAAVVSRSRRDEFLASHPHPFLVAETAVRPIRPMKTMSLQAITAPPDPEDLTDPGVEPVTRIIQEIRKKQDVFGDMITVGRTTNHDVVLVDTTISKFHAWFRRDGDSLFLVDAGSRNGTFVTGRPLEPKVPCAVKSGDVLRFGTVVATLHDAASLWAMLCR